MIHILIVLPPDNPSQLSNWPSRYPDLSNEYRIERENPNEKEEILGADEGDIADR
jgi:hypothetical protein